MAATPSRILLVDDHKLVRQGLRVLLSDCADLEVIGDASDGREAVEKARTLQPDVILMDIHMPGGDGLSAIPLIREVAPSAKVVVLTIHGDDPNLVYQAISAGAVGYVPKNSDIEEVIRAVRQVLHGQAAVMASSLTSLLNFMVHGSGGQPTQQPERLQRLSGREMEVLRLVAQGASNREIATKLYLSESTVRSHLHNILEKLQLDNRVQAAAYALRMGITASASV